MTAPQSELDEAIRKERMARQNEEINDTLAHIRHKILVMSGKGGVGKSSVSACLAVSLARLGRRVGLLDVDLHGPSIPRLLGLQGQPGDDGGDKLVPVRHLPTLDVMSIEILMEDKDCPTIWRGPLKGVAIRQFISDIRWNDLDYLIIDSPPGTGDEPMTVAQTIPDAKALIVTTPQEISLADVRKSIHFCRKVEMDILGLVENMSGLTCPHCGKGIDLFGTHGGRDMAAHYGLLLLASLPIDPEVVRGGDAGDMRVLADPDSPYGTAFAAFVATVEKALDAGGKESPTVEQAG